FVADTFNHLIRKISPAGEVTTLAGSTDGYADGKGNTASFSRPASCAVDASGNVFVADTFNHRIRKISPAGEVTTLAGSIAGYADGKGNSASFFNPQGVAVDASGNVFVADTLNHRIRKISPLGEVTTLAGNTNGGHADGTGGAASFVGPMGIAVDARGYLYVSDSPNCLIRKISPAGEVTTLAGSTPGHADGTGSAASFTVPTGIAVDSSGNLFVADSFNHLIRKITPVGVVTTLAGSTQGHSDGTGAFATFYNPVGIAVDARGILYVADSFNHLIRKMAPSY
ncbi:MAG TPA: hypothetical protein DD435_05835, partial [Cyanobacteria bacterium UBA8530]|nr:hypothetical protein [Cyanobacteria bacterium UBA8530]